MEEGRKRQSEATTRAFTSREVRRLTSTEVLHARCDELAKEATQA
eukprot:CAMPEP_0176078298 /NCGR_PEP_ID=MMETSP0120_2-20121206/39155_1 /TAXON_ID=160619 /ORGANISM="Kryptoperidinium foliaceum, Strain CCMP 1326" /LENGTH=44 /DNA_ID= /DNA_START= /DNA_END= /DNA_ORIENTATION=